MRGVVDRDRGYKRIMQQALGVEQLECTVGVQGADALEDHGGISNVVLAGVHEFGAEIDTGNGIVSIPERSFIRSTVDENDGYRSMLRTLGEKVLVGKLTVHKALGLLGEKVTSDIKSRIEAGIDPPLAASTIRRKGSSKPLIDSGQLKSAITSEVRRAGT